ncbi:hypothetical protein GF360_03150 [candidate division WWE3 bacterium]|nr:hypothetical protein [candidate division WWE3 bacterium]
MATTKNSDKEILSAVRQNKKAIDSLRKKVVTLEEKVEKNTSAIKDLKEQVKENKNAILGNRYDIKQNREKMEKGFAQINEKLNNMATTMDKIFSMLVEAEEERTFMNAQIQRNTESIERVNKHLGLATA